MRRFLPSRRRMLGVFAVIFSAVIVILAVPFAIALAFAGNSPERR